MSDSNTLSERAQQAAERLLEDEGLTGDLTDDQAQPLIAWASAAAARAADPAFSDEQLAASLAAIRKAVRQVARAAENEADPARLRASAEAALAALAPPADAQAAPAAAAPPAQPEAAPPAEAPAPPAADGAAPAPADAAAPTPAPDAAAPLGGAPDATPGQPGSIRALASRRISALAHMVSSIFQRRG
jgi:hypothetical protein